MTKEDILHHFQDINFYYGDCMMYADLSGMLDELIAENKCFDGMTNGEVIEEIYRHHSDMNCGSNGEYVHVWSNDGKCQMTIHKDFWNAPYQKGGNK